MKKTKKDNKQEKFIEEIVSETRAELEKRRALRLPLERQWELNLNFLNGNQYSDINSKGDIVEDGKRFYWQARGVYNHIATLIETRLAKLSKINPVMAVRPASADDGEMNNARLAEKILKSTFSNRDFLATVRTVTEWSETCGSGFYKILWDTTAGAKIGKANGKDVYEGDVKIVPVSPFEIFPDNLTAENVEALNDLIYATAVPVEKIENEYGVKPKGEQNEIFGGNVLENSVLLIERYTKPNAEFPNGRLVIVAGDKLIYYGELPYVNGKDGKRTFPFAHQTAISVAGEFFGKSIIQRLIPVQRAYNAVKNRKHEFLNRLTMGVVAVEDGSIDIEDLENDGLPPGKVIVYRQGYKAPEIVSENSLPTDFEMEEEKLLNEFVSVSGVSNVASSKENGGVTSGSALEILIEQDNIRMVASAEKIRDAYVVMATQTLRLYRAFMAGVKEVKTMDDESKTKIYYVDKKVLTSDDVVIVNENELLYGDNKRKEMLLELYKSGVFNGVNGKLGAETKSKLLSLLGYADVDTESSLLALHEEKAKSENQKLTKGVVDADIYDEHHVHIDEHTRYVLSEDENLSSKQKHQFAEHIKSHKQILKENENE